MGHKVSPLANRLGFTRTWNSRWFSRRQQFGQLLMEDEKIRQHLRKGLANAAVSKVEIERTPSRVRLIIHSARPGIVIGRRGADIDRLRDELRGVVNRELVIDIKEVKNPAVEPQLVAENIAFQLEKQIGFRRAMKRAIQLSMTSGARGIRLRCAGRLGGAEMSRVETYREGSVPLGTFRADIDFGFAEAKTTYGRIGVKCWLHRPAESAKAAEPAPLPAAAVAPAKPAGLPPTTGAEA
ncbi:MAG: 30S ribosomal protein S3 [Candidatus Omnitrophica bacterium]|nr:30S ribosomal protein S3 [Candidatus Omnitrophota bacterium]